MSGGSPMSSSSDDATAARLARIDATFLDDDLREQARAIVLGDAR